ncbi:hypothetical protein, partial [Thiolapillus sp.]
GNAWYEQKAKTHPLAFFCKISHRVLNRPENRKYTDNVTLSFLLVFMVLIKVVMVHGTWYTITAIQSRGCENRTVIGDFNARD